MVASPQRSRKTRQKNQPLGRNDGVTVQPQLLFLALAGCLMSLSGCGGGPRADYSKLGLANVQGTVLFDGEPLAGAIVVFESPDQTYSYAQTDASGKYRLMFNSQKAGVTVGPKTVRIRTSGGLGEQGEETEATLEENQGVTSQSEILPACYNSSSQLQAEVIKGPQTLDFDLKSDCSVTGPTN